MGTPCLDHSHPQLRRPISQAEFRHEIASFEPTTCGLLQVVRICPGIHGDGPRERDYAHVICRPDFFTAEFDEAVLWLPRANRLGLIAHEIGHAYLGPDKHTEDEADEAALKLLGVQIAYDMRWPGKGLQTLVRRV